MKKFTMMALAVVAVCAMSATDASAQDYNSGYRFGVGLNYAQGIQGHHARRGIPFGFGGRIGFSQRHEAPPYFAQYPPVYYNGIVSRPYGISPYAAPPGIAPVEMSAPQPMSVTNPYFDQEIAPVSDQNEVDTTTDNKSTQIFNPYAESLTKN